MPRQPSGTVTASTSINIPSGFAEAFKTLAAKETETTRRARPGAARVTVRDMQERAIRDQLSRLINKKSVELSGAFGRTSRKVFWIEEGLLDEAKQAAKARNISTAMFILSACMTFLKVNGHELE